ncbi:MAG: glycosyltransferase family 39 protein, partial [Gemmataceae bacterium]
MDGRSPQGSGATWKPLALLLVVAAAIHAWQITHTVVAARDSIGFIRFAHRLEREPLVDVLRTSLHPPLYPLTVLAVSYPARLFFDVSDPSVMQYCAQVASALAGVLLVIPMFFLGWELFDRRVGFFSALMFQCLPVGSRALADGLTEGIYMLACATALWLAVRGLRRLRPLDFALAGICTGFGYLTRPEGLELPLAILAVLLMQPAFYVL